MKGFRWEWIAALAVLGFWALGAYNRVMALRGVVVAAWLQLDTVIQARQQAIGSLVDAVDVALSSERSAIDAMVAAQVRVATSSEVVRRRPTSEEPLVVLAKSEVELAAALTRLQALIEQLGDLRHEDAVAGPGHRRAAVRALPAPGLGDAANAATPPWRFDAAAGAGLPVRALTL
jgi:LemA protein